MKFEPSAQWKRQALAHFEQEKQYIKRYLDPVVAMLLTACIFYIVGWTQINLTPSIPTSGLQVYLTAIAATFIPVGALAISIPLLILRKFDKDIARISSLTFAQT